MSNVSSFACFFFFVAARPSLERPKKRAPLQSAAMGRKRHAIGAPGDDTVPSSVDWILGAAECENTTILRIALFFSRMHMILENYGFINSLEVFFGKLIWIFGLPSYAILLIEVEVKAIRSPHHFDPSGDIDLQDKSQYQPLNISIATSGWSL